MSEVATLIKEAGAIKKGKFKLSNGSLTDYYIDKYVFETNPDVLDVIADEIAGRLVESNIDVIAGPELGAVPLVTAVSLRTGIAAAYIRKGKKHYGTQARIEGTIEKGMPVAIVEDVTTTGGTILETAHLVEEVGGIVERLIVVVDRNAEAVRNVSEKGYDLEYLARVGEDLEVEDV
jgi:orotate phosphoribosyltransferase